MAQTMMKETMEIGEIMAVLPTYAPDEEISLKTTPQLWA